MKQSVASFINNMERLDMKVIISLVLLNIYGLIMVYSASAYGCSLSAEYNNDPMYLLKRQAVFVLMGFGAMLILRRMNYNYLRKIAVPIYILGILSIFLLKTSLGIESHNAIRWIRVFGVSVQIAEIVKITMIIGLAAFMAEFAGRLKYCRVVFVVWIGLAGIPALLIYGISDNLSSAIILLGIAFLLTFVVSSCWQIHIGALAALSAVIVYGRTYLKGHMPSQAELDHMPFRYGRLYAWIDPERYASHQGLQPLQGLYAVVNGGLFGKGLGRSIQKLDEIPEAQNDMIFSVVCEELGMVGAVVLIALFVYLIYYLVRIAANADNLFGKVLVLGFAFHIALQAVINIAVVLTLIPNTGVSLPFISYGGSAVFFTMLEMGIALSVDRMHMVNQVHRMQYKAALESYK